MTPLLPRARPCDVGVDATTVLGVLDGLAARGLELHSLMVVRAGSVVAEGWWAPYSPDRVHLLYSLSKSFTSTAVGFAVEEGLFALDDRIVDLLPAHRPEVVDERVAELTVHHVLSMSTGHDDDTLDAMYGTGQDDLVRAFLDIPPQQPVGSRHVYNNGTTYVLSVLVEETSGTGLLDYLRPRLLEPLGIEEARWDTSADGHALGFSGLHLQTEAVAAFGQLLLQNGVWHREQVLPAGWTDLATRKHIDNDDDPRGPVDWRQGYGYQYWMHRHGYRGDGAFGQFCVVVPSQQLVVATTAAVEDMQVVLDVLWDHLLPGLAPLGSLVPPGSPAPPGTPRAETEAEGQLRHRLTALALPTVQVPTGVHAPAEAVFTVEGHSADSPLHQGSRVTVEQDGPDTVLSLRTRSETFRIPCGRDRWAQGRLPARAGSGGEGTPVVARGGWCTSNEYVADVVLIETPHRFRVSCFDTEATAGWNLPPLTGPRLEHQQR